MSREIFPVQWRLEVQPILFKYLKKGNQDNSVSRDFLRIWTWKNLLSLGCPSIIIPNQVLRILLMTQFDIWKYLRLISNYGKIKDIRCYSYHHPKHSAKVFCHHCPIKGTFMSFGVKDLEISKLYFSIMQKNLRIKHSSSSSVTDHIVRYKNV